VAKVERTKFVLHEFQSHVWEADLSIYRELLLSAGEQGGKTILGALWTKKNFEKWRGQPVSWVVGSPTYKVMEQSVKPTYLKIFSRRDGEYNKGDEVFQLKDGRMIWFRSSTDPDSVVGIPNVVGAHVDELGKCSRMFYYNVRNRSARLQGPTLGTTSAYALNFVKTEIIDPVLKDKDKEEQRSDLGETYWSKTNGMLYTRFASIANPAYPKEEYERMKEKLPERIFKMRFQGIHDRPEGLVFDMKEANYCKSFSLPHSTKFFGGIDWGFNHPMAVVVRAYPGDGRCYTVSVFKKSGLSVSQAIDVVKAKKKQWNVGHFYCGHDRPDIIKELNAAGVQASNYLVAGKEFKAVNAGNQLHASLIDDRKYQVFEDIEQIDELKDEYQTYVWDEKTLEDGDKEKPVNVNDDLMAAERYCSVCTCHLLTSKVNLPKVPLGTNYIRDDFDPNERENEGSWDAF
jgi:hypothetical protein